MTDNPMTMNPSGVYIYNLIGSIRVHPAKFVFRLLQFSFEILIVNIFACMNSLIVASRRHKII